MKGVCSLSGSRRDERTGRDTILLFAFFSPQDALSFEAKPRPTPPILSIENLPTDPTDSTDSTDSSSDAVGNREQHSQPNTDKVDFHMYLRP